MKTFLFLLLSTLPMFAAEVKISELTASTSPSTNSWLLISDMNAATKSQKYLLTNLVFQASLANYMPLSSTNTFASDILTAAQSAAEATLAPKANPTITGTANFENIVVSGTFSADALALPLTEGPVEMVIDGGTGDTNLVSSPVTSMLYKVFTNAFTGTKTIVLSDSPALTGDPTVPTPAENDNDTSVATTAYVQTEIAGLGGASAFARLADYTHAGTVTLDFSADTIQKLVLTGAVTIAFSNLATNRVYDLLIANAQATNCAVTLPTLQSMGFIPSYITAGKHGRFWFEVDCQTNTTVFATYAEQP